MAEEKNKTIETVVEKKTEEAVAVKADAILGKKVGMTQVFDSAGNVVSATVIEAGPCVITQVKTKANDGYDAIQVGFGKAKRLNKPMQGHQKKAFARALREIRMAKVDDYKTGQEIKASIFKVGELVTISGLSIGKGFAGVIKHYHHARGPMSHGSKSHRIPGSIGGGTTPGRVLKGRVMPGRMGGVNVKVRNVEVVEVNAEKNLILVHGSVPGKKGNLVMIERVG